jgi:hypothetical protein
VAGEPAAAGLERDPARQDTGRHAQLERAAHVGAPQRRQEAGLRVRLVDDVGCDGNGLGALGQVGPTEDHRDRPVGQQRCRRLDRFRRHSRDLFLGFTGQQRPHQGQRVARAIAQRVGRQARRGGLGRRQLHDLDIVVEHGVPQPEEQDRQLFLGVGPQQQHGTAGPAGVVDGGRRQPEHSLGRQAVAQLGVDVVRSDDALGELHPGIGVLVREAGAAQHREPCGPAPLQTLADRRRGPP